ncbi:hypothetical protein ACOMHN_066962 [Nucella lapillus]
MIKEKTETETRADPLSSLVLGFRVVPGALDGSTPSPFAFVVVAGSDVTLEVQPVSSLCEVCEEGSSDDLGVTDDSIGVVVLALVTGTSLVMLVAGVVIVGVGICVVVVSLLIAFCATLKSLFRRSKSACCGSLRGWVVYWLFFSTVRIS